MDLNPFPPNVWTSIEGPYELAEYVLDQKTTLLVVLCAWLDSRRDLDSLWDVSTLNYWTARLRPLWKKLERRPLEDSETIVVLCNRSGLEGGQCIYASIRHFSLFAFCQKRVLLAPQPSSNAHRVSRTSK